MTAALPADVLPPIAAVPECNTLLAHARFPDHPMSIAFAGVIAEAFKAGRRPLIRGIDERGFAGLMQNYFPGLNLSNGCMGDAVENDEYDEYDEYGDLVTLLMTHRRHSSTALEWLSHAVASASFGANHLWQDMGLPSRAVLSQLMSDAFPALAAKNTGDMKWKKFFYRQICEHEEILICKSPNCADCRDYPLCFGPET